MKTNWQKIEDGELKHSSVHHLMAIHELKEKFGYARITDISQYLDITRGSVSITMSRLNEMGFLKFDANKHITLTEKGQTIVDHVLIKRTIKKNFFVHNLFISDEEATKSACKMEHVISDEIIIKLEKLVSFLDKKLNNKDFHTELKNYYSE